LSQSERLFFLIVIWFTQVSMSTFVFGQDPNSAQELLSRSIEAEGGKAKWNNVRAYRSISTKTISLNGKASVTTKEVLEIDLVGNRWRLKATDERNQLRVTVGNSKRTTVYKTQEGKTVGGADTPPDIPTWNELNRLQPQLDSLKLAIGPVDSQDRCTLKSENGTCRWLFDCNTFLLNSKEEQSNYGQSDTSYSDYREVNGLLRPFQITTTVKEVDYMVEQKFESIDLDATFEETAFDFDDSWRKIRPGERMPEIDLVDAFIDGKKWARQTMNGSYVLIDFWATWCGPCVAEFPTLRQTYNRFKDRGFSILAVSLDSDSDQYRKYVKEKIPEWGNVLVEDGFDSELARRFELSSIPRTILIDPNGIIVAIDDEARGENLLRLLNDRLPASK
jgi:thiol-disulfide isomerase/thioredoxin